MSMLFVFWAVGCVAMAYMSIQSGLNMLKRKKTFLASLCFITALSLGSLPLLFGSFIYPIICGIGFVSALLTIVILVAEKL